MERGTDRGADHRAAQPDIDAGWLAGRWVDPALVLAALPRDVDAVVTRDDRRTIVAAQPDASMTADSAGALSALDDLDGGWWAGWLTYEIGRAVERVNARGVGPEGVADLVLSRFDCRLVLDPVADTAHLVGDGPALPLLERALGAAPDVDRLALPALARWTSSLGREDFEARVEHIVALIEAGDCYQVNLTRRLASHDPVDPVLLHAALGDRNPAPHAAFVRSGRTTVVSASPERFLHVDGDIVETRPIKGTGVDGTALATSPKDRAENVMIVDLARNDLGRVCRYGTIEVPSLCHVEEHPGLVHLVSTVRGRLRDDATTGDLIRATFPPASVTGAPKPRVMQAIEDLEPVDRGVYCGAVGWFDVDARRLDLNVAIRTFTVHDGTTTVGVGGGIVADSNPRHEWEETELKARRILEVAGTGALAGVSG